MEQMLLWDPSNDNYFKDNGDLAIDYAFYDEKISRVLNISFKPNPTYAVYRRTAAMCERLN